jgi:ketosteroid isomerase-like protein
MNSVEKSVVTAFFDAINGGDVVRLVSLMAEDHVFIDSGGAISSGREQMAKGWSEYFKMFPDYHITIEHLVQEGTLVAAFGMACGTYKGRRGLVEQNRISMPAAWKAVVENGKIKLWQVYADWSEGRKVIETDQQQGNG